MTNHGTKLTYQQAPNVVNIMRESNDLNITILQSEISPFENISYSMLPISSKIGLVMPWLHYLPIVDTPLHLDQIQIWLDPCVNQMLPHNKKLAKVLCSAMGNSNTKYWLIKTHIAGIRRFRRSIEPWEFRHTIHGAPMYSIGVKIPGRDGWKDIGGHWIGITSFIQITFGIPITVDRIIVDVLR